MDDYDIKSIFKMIAEYADVSVEDITFETKFEGDLGMGSLDRYEIFYKFEEAAGIAVPEEAIYEYLPEESHQITVSHVINMFRELEAKQI